MLKQELLLLVYNKDVICIIDRGERPVCKTVISPSRRTNNLGNVPIYQPYIPRRNPILFECSELECMPIKLKSLTQVTSPKLKLIACFWFDCETIQFNYFKNIDKLLFLSIAIPNNTFYLLDCLIYDDGVRVCHKNNNINSHAKLTDLGIIVRQNEPNILSQDEFLCEETENKIINCDLNPYIPFEHGLERKTDFFEKTNDILLKSGNYVVVLKYYCTRFWCGYRGRVTSKLTRRAILGREKYETPGGKVYRCFYANRQQVCKRLYGEERNMYNKRDYHSSYK